MVLNLAIQTEVSSDDVGPTGTQGVKPAPAPALSTEAIPATHPPAADEPIFAEAAGRVKAPGLAMCLLGAADALLPSCEQGWKARVSVVGVHDGKRVVNWPGVALSSSLMAGLFLTGALLPRFLSSHPFPSPFTFSMMVVLITATMSLAIYLGLRKRPIEKLVRLEEGLPGRGKGAGTTSDRAESRVSQTSALPMKRRLGAVALILALAGLALALPLGWWRIHHDLRSWSVFDALRTSGMHHTMTAGERVVLSPMFLIAVWALLYGLVVPALVLGILARKTWAGRVAGLLAAVVVILPFLYLLWSSKEVRHRIEVIRREGAFPPTGEVLPTRLDPTNAMAMGFSRGSTTLNFGPEAKGLRAAAELSSSHGVFALGEPIAVLFHIRNTSSTNINVAGGRWRQDDAHYITIEDQQGQRIPAQHIYHSVRTPIQRNLLLPGESAVFHSSGLAFLAKDADGKQVTQPVGNYVKVTPGRYTVRYRLRFPDLEQRGFPQSSDWQGALDTAPVTVEVTAANKSAAAPAFGPVIERGIRSATGYGPALSILSLRL